MKKKRIILIMVLTILLTSGMVSAQDELPLYPPPGYYGSILVNGQEAPPGTTIIAKIGGEVRGSIMTSASGLYGDNPGPSKLWLTGYNNELVPTPATVTFYVKDIASQQTSTLKGVGTTNRVDLSFIIPSGAGPGGTGDGGGGGSGGGGVVSAEPFENIDFFETRDADLMAGRPVTFRFTNAQIAVYELVITANISAGLTSAKIEQLKSTSRSVILPPSGTIYKNLNIWLGTSGFAVPRNIREGIIRFRVDKSWLSSENIKAISLMRWDGSKWLSLETKQVNTDDNFTYYEVRTDSFSPFAISGVKAAAATETPIAAPGSVSPKEAPLAIVPPTTSLSWILYVIGAIIIIAAIYYYGVKKK